MYTHLRVWLLVLDSSGDRTFTCWKADCENRYLFHAGWQSRGQKGTHYRCARSWAFVRRALTSSRAEPTARLMRETVWHASVLSAIFRSLDRTSVRCCRWCRAYWFKRNTTFVECTRSLTQMGSGLVPLPELGLVKTKVAFWTSALLWRRLNTG